MNCLRRRQILWGFSICCWALITSTGCSQQSTVEAPFDHTRSWQVTFENQSVAVKAHIQPDWLQADRPAMLEARFRTIDSTQPFTGRLWYRFAHRRGDPLPLDEDLAVRPPKAYEEVAPPHFDDRFAWAEIVEPRIENGETVFSTPVMFAEGKCYIQFRIAVATSSEAEELLDWFVYVKPAD
jgi:hypothetical protein